MGREKADHRPPGPEAPGPGSGKGRVNFHRRFLWVTLLCALVPLLAVGWFINHHYTAFSKERMKSYFEMQADYHRRVIELFLKERRAQLRLTAQTHTLAYLRAPGHLRQVFEAMNQEQATLTDLGIIGEKGEHLAYVGPYDLMDKNYAQAFWFRAVMEKGLFISDMFLGFRKVPHFIIAVRREEGAAAWILRATVDTESFRALVENVRLGKTGEVFLLNSERVFQTAPRFTGKIMDRLPFALEPMAEGARTAIQETVIEGVGGRPTRHIIARTWLESPRWLLVVKQEYGEALAAIRHAHRAMLIFLHLSAAAILMAAVFMARHLTKLMRKRDREADQLNRQLMQAGKLASIGELSAGVAHEINNPLAVMLTERQILIDLAERTPALEASFRAQLFDSLSQIDVQVQRCKRITHNLLRFARRTRSVIETVDLNGFLRETIELLEREARTSGVEFSSDLQEDLPKILSDPSQLQQVFLNLLNNAVEAHQEKTRGMIRITTRSAPEKDGVIVSIADRGSGISPENLEKIFDPFFTTKPVGKGTGLGLSICYSIIQGLGGQVSVESEVGSGTRFTLFFPRGPSPNPGEQAEACAS